jgi:tetratricopeptide (TPR) repeat protein
MPATLALFVLALVSTAPDAGVPTKSVMQGAFDSLSTLVWLTSGTPTPAQRDSISGELGALEALPHAFPPAPGAQEPGIAAIASLFQRYAASTRQALNAGDVEAVGHRVRTMASLCFACHSREVAPRDFADAEKRFQSLSLSRLEQARVLAATRQFDQALAAYAQVLDMAPTGLDFARALEDSLTILIRVKDDAPATRALLEKVLKRPGLPPVTRTALTTWLADVRAWEKERFVAARASSDALLKRAEALAKQDGDVAILRAAAYASHALSMSPKHPRRGEALWVLGVSAGRVQSPLLWDLDLLYLEACIREFPRTPLARRCADRLTERVVLGFTGSAGTNIPPDEQARLDELRGLAGHDSGR